MKAWLAALACAAAAIARADAPPALGAAVFASRDSEGLRIERAAAGAFLRYAHEGDATGLRLGRGHYEQDGWRRPVEAVTLLHRNTDRGTAEGLRLATGLSRQGERQLATAEVDWSREVGPGTRVGALYARDWVETRAALEAGLRFDMLGASVDQAAGPLTIVGFYGAQRFSDGNLRHHLRGRLVAPLSQRAGITGQLRYRAFLSGDPEVERRYFNPRRYDQALAVLAMRRRLEGGYAVLAEAGLGRQSISGAGSSPASMARVAASRTFPGGAALRLEAAHLRAASLAGPGYRQRSLALEAELPF